MGDMGDYFNDLKSSRKERRAELGVNCPSCATVRGINGLRGLNGKRSPVVSLVVRQYVGKQAGAA